uniref:Rad50/SbcC-type AAA domain-containing protein n=1 Tax=Mycobacterium sp. (strain MCS) TaxID=164756 RepID=A0A5Q5BTA1_MYCSS
MIGPSDIQIILGKVRPLSRPLTEAHPQVLIIAHMRLGACQTWMNTTPTLAGLAYAIGEYDRRVYVGLEPPALSRIRKNPERFIERVQVKSEKDDHSLFDHDLPLNSGFVAVVGNKGQGKSALLDCIALGGNSSRSNEFAFLRPSRFLSAPNQKLAREYRTKLVWATGVHRETRLNQSHDRAEPVLVEYLPQMFVELNHPAFDAHLLPWEGACHAEQVRPGDPSEGGPSGARAPGGLSERVGGDYRGVQTVGDERRDAA